MADIDKKLLMFALIFCGSIAYLFYSFFYQTSGRNPDWVYETPRPFLAGWSTVSPPLIQDDVIYFCAGYGWSDEVSLSALKKDGTLIWKTIVQYRCNEFAIQHDKIYVGQNHVYNNPNKQKSGKSHGLTTDYRTLIIDSKNGQVIQTLPFEYSYLSENNIYATNNDHNLYIYDLQGKEIKKIPLPSPSFVRTQQNNYNALTLMTTADGFWRLNTDENNINFVSDKGRHIHSYRSSDQYFCYTSYDGKYNLQKQNRDIDAKISCRRTDNWEKIIDDKPLALIDCMSFYLDNNLLFLQKKSCDNHDGYLTINLNSKDEELIPFDSSRIPRIMLGYNSTPHFYTEPLGPREIVVKDKETKKEMWKFKSTGWVHGFVEGSDAVYIHDDDGKLYMFKKIEKQN